MCDAVISQDIKYQQPDKLEAFVLCCKFCQNPILVHVLIQFLLNPEGCVSGGRVPKLPRCTMDCNLPPCFQFPETCIHPC